MRVKVGEAERRSMAGWLETRGFTHFVTLAFNPNKLGMVGTGHTLLLGGSQRAVRRLQEWDARVNRRALGRRWSKKVDERMRAAAFLEHPRTNTHWHLLALPPVVPEPSGFVHFMEAEWRKLEPNGTVQIEPIYDSKQLSRYVTKELGDPECWEHFELLGPRIS
ncbi:hypothetical protein [Parvibaculum sp.]|jgi:hypothetical protein|uniref:hypothetical protein n=1 Tax=Parvibaculum sp. TaxID=2024848 RepID=UPI000C44F4B5|nr:hypothetical protein [Parvibaculum sp.]MAM94352.1 hypothetical protein [Parvibaculum sp.]HCX66246.1 hypothetical protein [Rhodobiaceae bacterium]|tara:strand:- start:37185 stop:37676 length:492 start_codon:yes stop_codon:yes gene_type:complete